MEESEGLDGEITINDPIESEVVDTPIEAPESDAPVEAPKEEFVKGESARDSAKKAFEKLSKGESTDLPDPKDPSTKIAKKEDTKVDGLDPELLPPERLKPQAKQMFNNLPKGLKREFNRTVRDLEVGVSKVVSQYQGAHSQVKSIIESVQPFAADWAKMHVSLPQGIAEMAAVFKPILNPETRAQGVLDLAIRAGLTPEMLSEGLRTGKIPTNQQNDITNHPQIRSLQEENAQIKSYIEQQQIKPLVDEMATVKFEKDPQTGNFRYPELQDGSYLTSLGTRIEELVSTAQLNHAQALRQATEERRAKLFGTSIPAAPLRPQSQSNNGIQQRAAQAAVTVRGRTSPTTQGSQDFNPPPEALRKNDPRATVMWALEHERNKRG